MDWPLELVDDLARRKAVLFLGAGVSMNATNGTGQRPPDGIGSYNSALNSTLATVP